MRRERGYGIGFLLTRRWKSDAELRTSKSRLGGRCEGDATKTVQILFYAKPFHRHQSIDIRILNLPRKTHLATALPLELGLLR